MLRSAGGWRPRELRLAERHRAVVQQPRFLGVQEFPFGGNKKFQFRLSAYNVFNHPQRAPDDAQNFDLNYTNGSQTNANFGLLPTDNKYGHRILQLAFKFYF